MTRSPFLDRAPEPQVFVDPTGRRELRVRAGLVAAVAAAAIWLACLAAGCVGFTGLPAMSPLHAMRPHPHRVDVVQRVRRAQLRPEGRS
jgi:hypothetical protein